MTAIVQKLGRLEKVTDIRSIWASESGDFTPWLAQAENIAILGEAISIDLEVEAQEKDVGPFRADILCKDAQNDAWVLIENQLERTDHTHLGQLMTYAAGLKAVTIVWIAQRFTEEHRAALDWLNSITDGRFNFFGLEIELWRIGDSPVAPKFNVVCQPNGWTQTVSEAAHRIETTELTDNRRLKLDFWTGFRDYALEHAKRIKPQKPYPSNWMGIAIGRAGFALSAVCSMKDSVARNFVGHEIRAEMVVSVENSRAYFSQLENMKAQIESELGEVLIWTAKDDVRSCKAYLRRSVDLTQRDQWPEYFNWLVTKLDALHTAFSQRIKALVDASGAGVADEPT